MTRKRPSEEIDIEALIGRGQEINESDPKQGLEIARRVLRHVDAQSTEAAQAHLLAGMCEMNLGHFDAAARRFRKALDVAEIDMESLISARHCLGTVAIEKGEWVTAIEHVGDAIDLARRHRSPRFELATLNTMGIIYRWLGDPSRAMECWQGALQIAREIGAIKGQMATSLNIATVHGMLGNLDAAEQQLLETLSMPGEHEQMRNRITVYHNLGLIRQRRGDVEGQRMYGTMAVELARSFGVATLLVSALMDLAVTMDNAGDLVRARELAEEAITAAAPDTPQYWMARGLHGYLALSSGEIASGLEELHEALGGCERFDDWHGIEMVTKTLYEHYESTGQAQRALEYYRRHNEIVERTRGREQQRRVTQMEMRAEIERVEREREAARRQAEELAREVESKEKELASMALDLVDKSRFLHSLKGEISDVARNADTSLRPQIKRLQRSVEGKADAKERWKAFEQQFELMHGGFLRSLLQRFPDLTRMELKVCALLKLNLSSKEMGEILSSSVKTVESHRYNIRRKLQVPDDVLLTRYFMEI